MIAETAFAKINLALHVRRRRADGYHDIETLFAFVDQGDVLEVAPAENGDVGLKIIGPFGAALSQFDVAENLIVRAARAMQGHFGVTHGADITLTKNLPIASGIGGGSADAAAAARGLNRLWGLDTPVDELVRAVGHLGADIPACLYSKLARGEGVGEGLRFLNNTLTGTPVLLANPLQSVSTAAVFSAWEGQDLGALGDIDAMAAALAGRNDLEAPALGLCPDIAHGLAALRGQGEILLRMSGSGATIFALYPDAASRDLAAAQFAEKLPQWWTMKGQLL